MEQEQLKIKWVLIRLTKKQFFIFYGFLLSITILASILEFFFPVSTNEHTDTHFWIFFFDNFQFVSVFLITGLIWEAQFFWHRFTAEQLDTIKEQNIALERHQKELEEKNHEISVQKKNIEDSIYYAQRIQTALLPSVTLLKNTFPEHFVFFRPKDIVSGDFYWLAQTNQNQTIVIVADCTGHGVPGAFMSMLSIAFLNEIIAAPKITPADLLNQLRKKIIHALAGNHPEYQMKDGLDAAAILIDTEQKMLLYSGANNPLYKFNQQGFTEYKAQRMPIGSHKKENTPFENQLINYNSQDMLYLFSDGFVDQFGEENQRKYLSKNFKILLNTQFNLDVSIQKQNIIHEFENWKQNYPQIDDILVMGLRL